MEGRVGKALTVAAVAVLALAPGCRRSGDGLHARVDPAIAPLIPSETVLIAGLRLDKLKGTPFWRDYVEGRRLEALKGIEALTGLDPAKNLWEIVVARSRRSSVVFLRGKFGGEFGLEPRLDIPGSKRSTYKGYYILQRGPEGILFLNTGVAAVGSVKDLQWIVDNRDKPGESPPDNLLALVRTVPGSAHFYAVTLEGWAVLPNVADQHGFVNAARMMRNLGTATFQADLGDGIRAKGEGVYPDAASARVVRDTLRGFLGVARLESSRRGSQPLKIYNGIQVEADGNKVEITLTVPPGLIDEILGGR